MAGYSTRPLIDKLGIKPGHRVLVLAAPQDYPALLPELVDRAVLVPAPGPGLDVVHIFVRGDAELRTALPQLIPLLVPNGMIWVSWAKKASPLHTGLTDNSVREIGLAAGVVDVKIAAIDEDWSGMKFVIRLRDRM